MQFKSFTELNCLKDTCIFRLYALRFVKYFSLITLAWLYILKYFCSHFSTMHMNVYNNAVQKFYRIKMFRDTQPRLCVVTLSSICFLSLKKSLASLYLSCSICLRVWRNTKTWVRNFIYCCKVCVEQRWSSAAKCWNVYAYLRLLEMSWQ